MEKKLFDILKERGYVKDLTHEREIIDLVNAIIDARKGDTDGTENQ